MGSKLLRTKMGAVLHAEANTAISAKNLINLKQKALRRGLWFKTLNRLDRLLVDLTIRVSSSVHSSVLVKGLLTVKQKLQVAFESKLNRATRTIGFPLARKLSIIAQNWNYKAAETWATDQGFAHYLALMNLHGFVT